MSSQCAAASFDKSVNSVGQLNLDPAEFYDGPSDYQSITVSQSQFDCDDVGQSFVLTLTVVDAAGATSTCDFALNVTDDVAPVAICETDVIVQLNANGEAILFPEAIDEGSYDNCGVFQLDLSQTNFSCADVGAPINITLAVLDVNGNFNHCITSVIVEPYPNPTQNLACNDNVFVSLDNTGMAVVTADMILEGGPYRCYEEYTVVLEFGGAVIPNNTLTSVHAGQEVQATITDPITGNSCWGLITVSGDPTCVSTFNICDTECRTAPLGDCASGHTDTDNIEWPCDLDLNYCGAASNAFTFQVLLAAGVDPADVQPTIIDDTCGLVAWSYSDVITTLPNGASVSREWTIIDWIQFDGTNGIWSYTQNITATADTMFICDILPWNTPIGDCASGHTLDDDIEWPADFTTTNCNVNVDALAADPNVNPNDVRPQFTFDCDLYAITHTDVVIVSDSLTKVLRTWTVLNWLSGAVYEYNQLIKIENPDCAQSVCAYDMNGNGIGDVIIHPGYTTSDGGCVSIDDPTITIVRPVKIDDMDNGVDVYDLIATRRHILGIESLNAEQQLAADVNGNGVVTSLDLVLMEKIILNEPISDTIPAWRFYDPSLDISTGSTFGYSTLGIKVGDVDASADIGGTPIPRIRQTVGAEDDILNNGETYMLPIHTDRDQVILGFQIQLELDQNFLALQSVTSSLSNFSEENYRIEEGILTINWTPLAEDLGRGGIRLDRGDELFQLELQAVGNGVFSRDLRNGDPLKNKIIELGFENKGNTTLVWSNEVFTGNRDLAADQTLLSVFPNPASDYCFIQMKDGQNKNFEMQLFNTFGQLIDQSAFFGELKYTTDHLSNGFYIVQVKNEDGQTFIKKLNVAK